jgi:hypothetical protein
MRVLVKSAILLAGIVVIQTSTGISQQQAIPLYDEDPRKLALQDFFESLNSPASSMAEDFLYAADRNGLDWRLLPSIAIVESGGGREALNNNILGWDSCQQAFPTVQDGIHHVASRLANSKLYCDKSLDEKLALYNPNHVYPAKVKFLMARLAVRLDSASLAD